MISLTKSGLAAALACAVPIAGLVGYSAELDGLRPEIRREAEKMRKVLEENFRACNEENIKALMATQSPTMPGLAEFHRESLKMFAETDVYLSLNSFELIRYRPRSPSPAWCRSRCRGMRRTARPARCCNRSTGATPHCCRSGSGLCIRSSSRKKAESGGYMGFWRRQQTPPYPNNGAL